MYVDDAELEPSCRITRWGCLKVGFSERSSEIALERSVRIDLRVSDVLFGAGDEGTAAFPRHVARRRARKKEKRQTQSTYFAIELPSIFWAVAAPWFSGAEAMLMTDDLKLWMGVEEKNLNERDDCKAVRDGSVCADFDANVENVCGSDDDEETVGNRPTTLGAILID